MFVIQDWGGKLPRDIRDFPRYEAVFLLPAYLPTYLATGGKKPDSDPPRSVVLSSIFTV